MRSAIAKIYIFPNIYSNQAKNKSFAGGGKRAVIHDHVRIISKFCEGSGRGGRDESLTFTHKWDGLQ